MKLGLKAHPEYILYSIDLNAKQFGKKYFEKEKDYIASKFQEVKFDGILITDNDALDFVIEFQDELFKNIPIVFTGISNPEDYSLQNKSIYGFTEMANTDQIIYFVKDI